LESLSITIDEAQAYLKAGGVGVAEMILRQLIERILDSEALTALSHIAACWGRIGGRRVPPPCGRVAPGRCRAARFGQVQRRHLLIKAWGNGFSTSTTLGHLFWPR
jgi:hypothetical protein